MIPEAAVTGWGEYAPWPTPFQIEQDLLLSRLMIEIAQHERLGDALAMRGGTCFQKLCLDSPRRYSEDLDYVRVAEEGPIGSVLDDLRAVAEHVGFSRVKTSRKESIFRADLIGEPTNGPGLLRVKVEINATESMTFFPLRTYPLAVASDWWSGASAIPAYEVEELLATKLRALYQRNKGRDLFDVWLALMELRVDEARVMDAHAFYMGNRPFSYRQLRANLLGKLADQGFRHDLDQLVVKTPSDYDVDLAADVLMERLGARLTNAPPAQSQISGRAWRNLFAE